MEEVVVLAEEVVIRVSKGSSIVVESRTNSGSVCFICSCGSISGSLSGCGSVCCTYCIIIASNHKEL